MTAWGRAPPPTAAASSTSTRAWTTRRPGPSRSATTPSPCCPPCRLCWPSPSRRSSASTRLASQTKLLSQLSAVSQATLSGEGDLENLSAYFEPFGSALVPCAPGTRDSIASQESDSLLAAERKEASSCSETEKEAAAASPRVNMTPPLQLQTIPELDPVPDTEKQAKKQPPPTLPKPKKPTKVSPPVVAPKPKPSPAATNGAEQRGAAVNGGQSFQDETLDGSEV